MKVNLIAAVNKKNVIGFKNKLPWKCKDDMSFFKKMTSNNTVIMGRKTFESLGCKPLDNRFNIVISSQNGINEVKAAFVSDIESALNLARKNKNGDVFVIGGESIYNQTIDICDCIYLSVINDDSDGDSFFPNVKEYWDVFNIGKGRNCIFYKLIRNDL